MVLAQLDTLTNIEENWSINDLADAHEALDIKEEMERFYMEASRGNS